MSDRVRVIDAAVGALQSEVERLTERLDKLEGKFAFWFCNSELSDQELEEIARHHRRCAEERDADNERGDY